MKRFALSLLAIGLFVWGALHLETKPKFSKVDFSTMSQENAKPIEACRAKKTCVIAYVAPWCGACHQFVSQLSAIRQRLSQKDAGLLLVVGAEDDMRQKEEFLSNLQPDGVLDSPGDGFRRRHKVEFFPSFIVTDGNGDVIADQRRGRAKLNELLN